MFRDRVVALTGRGCDLSLESRRLGRGWQVLLIAVLSGFEGQLAARTAAASVGYESMGAGKRVRVPVNAE